MTEWVVAGIGALLVAGTIGYLIVLATLRRDATPPDGARSSRSACSSCRAAGWSSSARSMTAARPPRSCWSKASCAAPSGASETSEATIDYLPARSEREGGLIFSRDPRGHELRLRAKGYAQP